MPGDILCDEVEKYGKRCRVGGRFFLFAFWGSRGAVLMEIICSVLMILFFAKWKHKGSKISLIAAVAIVYLYSPLFEMIMLGLSSLASELGLSIRIFDKFLGSVDSPSLFSYFKSNQGSSRTAAIL